MIVRRFAQAGARAVIADIEDARAEATVRNLTAEGGDVRFVRTDVRDGAQSWRYG